MALRIALAVPALLCTSLLPGLAVAAPADAPAEAAVEAPAEAAVESGAEDPEPVATATSSSPTFTDEELAAIEAELEAAEAEPPVEDYYYPEEEWELDEPVKSKRTVLELDSGYFSLGIAPGMTVHDRGFHPNTRFEMEFGGTVEHAFRDVGWSFGVVTQLTPYYARKKPSFGADVTSTTMVGPFYVRTGLGAVGGLPRNHNLQNTAPGIGGVVGAGLNFGRAPMVRLGVDYDLRVTTKLEPVHTVFIALRLVCCRNE